MQNARKSIRRRLAVLFVPGGMVLGTSCVESIRESIVSGGLGFVEDTATVLLESVISVEDFLAGGE